MVPNAVLATVVFGAAPLYDVRRVEHLDPDLKVHPRFRRMFLKNEKSM